MRILTRDVQFTKMDGSHPVKDGMVPRQQCLGLVRHFKVVRHCQVAGVKSDMTWLSFPFTGMLRDRNILISSLLHKQLGRAAMA